MDINDIKNLDFNEIKNKFFSLFSSIDKDIYSVEEEQEKRSKRLKRFFVSFIFILPVFPAVWYASKAAYADYEENKRYEARKIDTAKLKDKTTESNDDSVWRMKQNRKNDDNDKRMDALQESMVKINSGVEKVQKSVDEISKGVANNAESVKKISSDLQVAQETNIEKLSELEGKLKKYVDKKVKKKITLSGSVSALPKSKKNDNLLPSPPSNKGIDSLFGDSKTSDSNSNNSMPEEEYVEKEFEIAQSSIEVTNISTLKSEAEVDKDEVKVFTIPMGAAKGIITTGGNLKTLQSGESKPKPIFIKITDDFITSNNNRLSMKGCVMEGAAVGVFATGSAEVRMKGIQCTSVDENGQEYLAKSTAVKAWVFDESNLYGIDSRVVTKEGEIFAKSLPLGFLNTASTMLTSYAQNTYTTNGVTGTSSTTPIQVPMTQSLSNEGQSVISKITDLWLKYLDTLTPIVQYRAGRKVTVAFADTVEMKWEKVNFFNSDELEREDEYNEL